MANISINSDTNYFLRSYYRSTWSQAYSDTSAWLAGSPGYLYPGAFYDDGYQINKACLVFDTSFIPSDYTISSVTLNLYTYNQVSETISPNETTTHVVSGSFAIPATVSDYQNHGGTSFGSVTYTHSNSAITLKAISLNASGIAAINTSGYTKFVLRNSYDLNNTAPSGSAWENTHWFYNYLADGQYTPSLTVVATAPSGYYCVQFFISANGSLSGSTFQTVASGGSTSAVEAVPDTTYQFYNWSYDSTTSTDNPLTITGATSELEVTANIRPIPPAAQDYGFICSTREGYVQVDGLSNNFYLDASGTASFDGNPYSGLDYWPYGVNVTLASGPMDSPALLAVKLDATDYFNVRTFTSGPSSRTADFVGEYGKTGYSVDYTIWRCATLANPVPADPSGWGMEVWDATGSYRVFSSGAKSMRLVSEYWVDCPIYANDGAPGSSTYVTVEDAVNNYFIMSPLGSTEDRFDISGTGSRRFMYANMFRRYDSTTVEISNRYMGYEDSSSYGGGYRNVYSTPKIRLIEISDRPAS